MKISRRRVLGFIGLGGAIPVAAVLPRPAVADPVARDIAAVSVRIREQMRQDVLEQLATVKSDMPGLLGVLLG